MPALGDLDRGLIRRLHDEELARFRDAHPRSLALLERARAHMPNGTPMAWMASDNEQPIYIDRGEGASFTDVDGSTYVDFNASDMSAFCGHAPPPIVRAVQERAARSTQFLLPTEESIGSPRSSRVATRARPTGSSRCRRRRRTPRRSAWRAPSTGRELVLLFVGPLPRPLRRRADRRGGRAPSAGAARARRPVTGAVRIAEFNDPDGLESALAPRRRRARAHRARDDEHRPLRRARARMARAASRRTATHGTLLALDETHTHIVGPGGATGRWGLEPDILTIGKAVAGGVPMGAYGVTLGAGRAPGRRREHRDRRDAVRQPPVGGRRGGGAHGGPRPRGLRAHGRPRRRPRRRHRSRDRRGTGLPWTTYRFGPRAGQWYGPKPRTGGDAYAMTDPELTALLRIWMANRGIWEALPGAGPTVPVPAERGRRRPVRGRATPSSWLGSRPEGYCGHGRAPDPAAARRRHVP